MITSNSSTPPLPKLERLLLDGDIDPELAVYLRAVGFDVRLAPRGSKVIRDDVKVLRLARKQDRILLCHDQHSDKETRVRLYPELHHRGGRILQIGGDSSQPVLTALGKILAWREDWGTWFKANDGKAIVYKERCVKQPALLLVNRIVAQQGYDIGHVLLARKRKPRKKTIRKLVTAPEQNPLI